MRWVLIICVFATFVGPAFAQSGAIRAAVIVVDFPYAAPPPLGTMDWMRAGTSTVDTFYTEQSYQQLTLTTDVWGIYTVPLDINATRAMVKAAAQQAASDAGVDLSVYSHFCYISPATNFVYGGWGDFSGCWIAVNSDFVAVPQWDTLAHELGHHLGTLVHAHGQGCYGCAITEYGDYMDVMGNHSAQIGSGHFNPIQKRIKGWLTETGPEQVLTATSDGDYLIAPYETLGGVKALVVQGGTKNNPGQAYYLTYQAPYVGAVVHRALNTSELLWMTPSTTTPAISVGQTHCWSTQKLSVSVLSVSSVGLLVHINYGHC